MARAEAQSRDAWIAELENCLSEVEDKLLKAEEGHALAEYELAKSREAKSMSRVYSSC